MGERLYGFSASMGTAKERREIYNENDGTSCLINHHHVQCMNLFVIVPGCPSCCLATVTLGDESGFPSFLTLQLVTSPQPNRVTSP